MTTWNATSNPNSRFTFNTSTIHVRVDRKYFTYWDHVGRFGFKYGNLLTLVILTLTLTLTPVTLTSVGHPNPHPGHPSTLVNLTLDLSPRRQPPQRPASAPCVHHAHVTNPLLLMYYMYGR